MLQRRDADIRDNAKHAVHIAHTMLATAIDRFGGPEVLNIHALPVPTVGPREVLIVLAYPMGVEPVPTKRRGIRFIAYDGVSGIREFERFNRAVTAAKLKVSISERFPLADAAKAHEHLAAGHVLGKTVLRIRHP